ncbi:MAG: DUF4258 domain-containing protein [Candidatus Binatia bacterium]
MSKIGQIRALVRNGLFYLTEHADNEALDESFNIYDIEYVLLNGHMRRTWPRAGTYEIVGRSLDHRPLGIVCRITNMRKVRVITVYEDKPKQ